ncbi:MAG: C10 family peptidase [Bacteroidota bacterium]
MKKYILFFVLLIIGFITATADEISAEYAKKIAKNLYYERASQIMHVDFDALNLALVAVEYENGTPVYYVFNVGSEGFVIISADNDAMPVIGYSWEGIYDPNIIPPSFEFMMNSYKKEIIWAKENNVKATSDIEQAWADLEYKDPQNVKGIKTIMPMLLTMWGQSGFYNDECPESGGEEAVVGCVAVSMAQVMKYYNHPDVGQGSHSYGYPSGWPTYWPYGTLSANFGATNYNWAGIPFDLNGPSYETARLLFHCGVAVDMYYSPTGSASQTSEVENALTTYFKYNANLVSRNSYTSTQWSNLLKGEIDNKRPIVYSGSDSNQGSGHAWNCDGYQGSEFHMNWGWDGAMNGYFLLTNLTAGGYTFDESFDAVIQIYPVSGYPDFCSGTKNINGVSGSFDDGSGNQNYHNNADCKYLIQPTCGDQISLTFDVFQLETNDVVYIHNGTTTGSPLLETYSGTASTGLVSADNGAMLLHFVSDGTGNDIGFYASYETEFCNSNKVITAPSGTIGDGSGSCEYAASTYCKWTIQPANAVSIAIDFTAFNLSSGDTYDYVRIYKDNTTTGNTIATFTSAAPPSGTITVPSGVAIVRFVTNTENHAQGWSLNYSTTVGNESPVKPVYNFEIMPNPVTDDATIRFSSLNDGLVSICITNLLGEVIAMRSGKVSAGEFTCSLSEIAQPETNGMYFVTIEAEGYTETRRIVITR